ncbi:hypothetical protein EUX98_g6765 [Antrodiella citrinella]|uniref:YTH domain-containing protein n=1 Tax=Antrodiella citrinella TaxID=2447956 RepID=A0A4S4MQQ7_9APHY|nr:hypothetical protein EUX98_g6765 [Antrodiella citrinella]
MNSLTAIAGHEGEEEEWEREMRSLQNDDDQLSTSDHGHQAVDVSSSSESPLSPHFAGGIPSVPSPPPPASGAAGVRRHQSLTVGSVRRGTGTNLRRAGTLQAPPIKGAPQTSYSGAQSPSPTNADEEYNDDIPLEEEGSYFPLAGQQGQSYGPTSPIGRSSPWSTPGADWRANLGYSSNANIGGTVDDVTRALSTLELNQQYANANAGGYQDLRNGGGSQKLQLVTDLDERQRQRAQGAIQSAAAYVPPIGHGVKRDYEDPYQQQRDRSMSTSQGNWDQKDRMSGRQSNPNMQQSYGKNGQNVPNVPPIPTQYLNNSGPAPRMGSSTPSNAQAQQSGRNGGQGSDQNSRDGFIGSPIDVPTLIATKGYNPVEFDTKPYFARYFVIKSYTEDDVHKSLKYEIWSSTDPGNKRLDKAYKETAGRGPIYLFFSVNASGHFCGMAQMLTPVDYSRSSTVWASDKWKGVFGVKWIFVRDIPNATLRHIRLNNTQERKPVTNSRDTQELLPDAGQEMLRIFHTHPARTSLLQDFAFYELQAMQKAQASQVPGQQSQLQSGASSPPPTHSGVHSPGQVSPTSSPGQHPFAMSNPAALAYAAQMGMPQMNMGMGMGMNPMLQMQMNMGNMGNAFANPHAIQSVMRHPSPGPMSVGQNYMNMGGMPGF